MQPSGLHAVATAVIVEHHRYRPAQRANKISGENTFLVCQSYWMGREAYFRFRAQAPQNKQYFRFPFPRRVDMGPMVAYFGPPAPSQTKGPALESIFSEVAEVVHQCFRPPASEFLSFIYVELTLGSMLMSLFLPCPF